MRMLVVYNWASSRPKNTIREYLMSFRNYSGEECYYLNTAYGVPGYITKINFDIVVFHCTFFDADVRFSNSSLPSVQRQHSILRGLRGYKVAVPQDDYRCSDQMNEFFRDVGVKAIFTPLPESLWSKIYPKKRSGLEHYFSALTGYIDDCALQRINTFNDIPHRSRPIDIGYRGSNPPYWLGRAGQMKWQLTQNFSVASDRLILDLSNDAKDLLFGDDWYRFLSMCRVMLGCEGGATLHDPDGAIRKKVDRYVAQHYNASFTEVEQACFPGLDGNLNYFALSPRSFDACMTRTCQVLIEGNYNGILKPGVHYIEIKKDWSNLTDVIRQIEDVSHCEQIADNAYRDIVESGLFTYRAFVRSFLNSVCAVSGLSRLSSREDARYLKALLLREKLPWLSSPVKYGVAQLREVIYKALLKLNLYKHYQRISALAGGMK